jgi:starch-binding outer membrane protein, SusD/RagB family
MKKLINKYIIAGCFTIVALIYACSKDFLEIDPLGLLAESTLANKAGVNGLLVGAYSLLDGHPGGNSMAQSMSNWQYGGVASDDAHKGSEYGDQTDLEFIENYSALPVNSYFTAKWTSLYTGVQRANDVLRLLEKVTTGITDAEKTQIKAEAIFLRALYHFEAAKLWRNIPYIDENVSFATGNYLVPNTDPVWPKIEADFQFAIDNLTTTKTAEPARANSWAAKAFMAKVYMFQQKFAQAKVLLDDIIANGVTAKGAKYNLLLNFADNFNPLTKNGAESVFAAQMSVRDNSNGQNGNSGELYSWNGGPTLCCGFYVPSFSLVNSYKTDPVTGLPLLDTWNNSDLKNDMGISSSQSFTPTTDPLDPRLDFTGGRRGIPYNDWGIMPGASWLVAQSAQGPYNNKKNLVWQKDLATTYENRRSSINYNFIRFADVLLWAAEVEVEIGDLAKAESYVNRVRIRAANPTYWIKTYIDPLKPMGGFTTTNAANYVIGLYTGQFATQGKDYARKAVRFERKLELAMEGHRFFDLQRYDNGTAGYMADVLNSYIAHENSSFDYLILKGAKFTRNRNELYPIPQQQIDLSMKDGKATLVQNPGYN